MKKYKWKNAEPRVANTTKHQTMFLQLLNIQTEDVFQPKP